MRDTCYGALGDKIAEINAEVDVSITEESINTRIVFLARSMRQEELARIESDAIAKYVEQIRSNYLADCGGSSESLRLFLFVPKRIALPEYAIMISRYSRVGIRCV